MAKEDKTTTQEQPKKEVEVQLVVVNELPTQTYSVGVDGEGNPVKLLTTNEAIGEILVLLRRAEKAGLFR